MLARIPEEELGALMEGYGYEPSFVSGDDPARMHQTMAATLDRAVARSIDAFSGPIIGDVVNAFSDREGGNLLARLSIQYRNLGSAAGNEQTMVRLIEGHGDVVLA